MNDRLLWARFLFLLIALLSCCFGIAQTNALHNVQLTVSSTDLSEDMSLGSTKNDELLLLIYKVENDSAVLKELTYDTAFVFDKDHRVIQLEWMGQNNSKYLYFLLELDSDKTSIQLDPVLRVYYKEVLAAFNKRDYTAIEKYLGDEDVLVANYFTIPHAEDHKGVYKADKYHYALNFSWKK
jgi:hypothetical protein